MTEQGRTGVIDLERTVAASSPGRTRRPRQRAAVLGVIAVLVVVLIVTLLAPFGSSDRTAGPGGRWRAVDTRREFGRDATVTVITARGSDFVALGQRRLTQADPAWFRPAVWTSPDGVHWDAVHDARFPKRPFWGFASAAVRQGVVVAAIYNNGELWRSADATTWHRVVRKEFHRGTTYSVSAAAREFVAVDSGPFGASVALTSRDGLRWTKARGTTTRDHPTGLFTGARLDRSWLTLGSHDQPAEAPPVYRSTDAMHWSRVVDADAPTRLAGPLVGNRARNRVLGIQFEAQGTFGGRLWSTPDGTRWSEIPSFHAQMPVANPDHMVPVGRWWVLGGNTGTPDGKRRASMWSTPDLRHWYELPAHLRGPKSDGTGVLVTALHGRVVGYSARGHGGGPNLWVWTPPD